jgi:hypothetical protein
MTGAPSYPAIGGDGVLQIFCLGCPWPRSSWSLPHWVARISGVSQCSQLNRLFFMPSELQWDMRGKLDLCELCHLLAVLSWQVNSDLWVLVFLSVQWHKNTYFRIKKMNAQKLMDYTNASYAIKVSVEWIATNPTWLLSTWNVASLNSDVQLGIVVHAWNPRKTMSSRLCWADYRDPASKNKKQKKKEEEWIKMYSKCKIRLQSQAW